MPKNSNSSISYLNNLLKVTLNLNLILNFEVIMVYFDETIAFLKKFINSIQIKVGELPMSHYHWI